MSSPVTFASAKQFVGLAKETVHGTPVAMTTTMPVEDFTVDQSFEQLKDASWRGHMGATSGIHQGVTKTEFDIKSPVFGDTIGHLLLNILGDLVTTGTAPNVHAFSLLNTGSGQPPSHTFTHFQGPGAVSGARQVPGACLSELSLKWNAESELFTLEGKGTGWGTVLVPTAAPVSAPSMVAPVASWRAALGIGGPASGGTIATNVSEFEVSIKRALKPIYTLSGDQDPYIIQRGTVEVTGKLMFIASSEAPLLAYLNNTQPAVQCVIDNGQTGANRIALQVDLAKAAYSSTKFSGGNEATEYETEFEAVSNPTDAGASGGFSPTKITLSNGVMTY